jgi:hypothetical protein
MWRVTYTAKFGISASLNMVYDMLVCSPGVGRAIGVVHSTVCGTNQTWLGISYTRIQIPICITRAQHVCPRVRCLLTKSNEFDTSAEQIRCDIRV